MPKRSSHIAALRADPATSYSKELRSDMTDAEHRIWYYIRGGRLRGWKFRRQVPLGNYIADFVCESRRLIVELDGGQHSERAATDAERTRWLEAQGYRVVRFWNNDVMVNTSDVLEAVLAILEGKSDPLPGPPPHRSGCPRGRENSA